MCVFEDVDQTVLKWVHVVRDKNIPLSGSLIKQQALKFPESLGHLNFQVSNGWLDKKRHGIVEKVISGESADVNEADCNDWRNKTLKKLLVEKVRMLMKQTAMI
ncbi:Tc5 transposase DNA-binding domain [Popillia japonica]